MRIESVEKKPNQPTNTAALHLLQKWLTPSGGNI